MCLKQQGRMYSDVGGWWGSLLKMITDCIVLDIQLRDMYLRISS